MLYKMNLLISGLLLTIFLSACGKHHTSTLPFGDPIGVAPGGGTSTFDSNEKSYLYNLFLTEYYWNDKVPQDFDYSTYTEPQPMINDLKYAALDRWSFALSRQQYDDMTTQKTAGFGFGYQDNFVIYTVLIDSPAQNAGLLRGDRIVKINGQPVTDTLLAQASSNLNKPTKFSLDRGGKTVELTITAQAYTYKVVAYSTVQTNEGKRVGYLRFDEFTDNATDELEAAFNYFKSQHINKLVIDLRYNPGGSVNTASIFLDKVGRGYNGQVQFTLAWNAENSYQNETLYFDSNDPNSLALDKLLFLTTSHSASASELVINAMEPYMHENVSIIGTRTHGKPVGMAGRTDGSYVYFLINFAVLNSVGYGSYFDGLAPDCRVEDNDFAHQLGDPNEALLHEALYYMDNGHC